MVLKYVTIDDKICIVNYGNLKLTFSMMNVI
jgi:hypothetical protein